MRKGAMRSDSVKRSEQEIVCFRQNLIRLQKESDTSNKDVAEVTGYSPNYITKIRIGHCKPSVKFAKDVADLFGVKESELFLAETSLVKSDREKYGRKIRKARTKMGMTQKEVAEYLGTTKLVYDEMERGLCSTADTFKEKLDELFFSVPKTYTVEVEKAQPVAEHGSNAAEQEDVSASKPAIPGDISLEVIDVLIKHVRDIKVSEDIQRRIFRELSAFLTKKQEERLFG